MFPLGAMAWRGVRLVMLSQIQTEDVSSLGVGDSALLDRARI